MCVTQLESRVSVTRRAGCLELVEHQQLHLEL
jgi:hypothetical protein